VDQELVEYLDRRFNEFRNALRNELRADLRNDLNDLRSDLRSEIAASAAETRSTLRAEIAAGDAETRRHFDVVAEHLMGKIQLVAEGVIGVDHKVDRLAEEMRAGFQTVDRRILHHQARVIGRD
jgi:hypothetical protein